MIKVFTPLPRSLTELRLHPPFLLDARNKIFAIENQLGEILKDIK
ncbi:hypothetical protein [Bacteroidetes bacterium endosymbiont of Geopemphigus sp.]|nr:hypothetical protein [Bacteroidetes bacterium endosymbiont of Geopemphigus sp.]